MFHKFSSNMRRISRVMFYIKPKWIPEHFITVERSCWLLAGKNLKDADGSRQRLRQMETEYLGIFDFSIEFSSLSRRVRHCQGNFRLLANRRGIILSGIFLPGVSRRHRRRRYRGTVTIVDVKVTRGGGRKRETELRGEEERRPRARAREWDGAR